MEFDAVLGILLVVASLFAITGLVAWSRMTINKIERKKLRTVRDIVKDFNGDER